MGQSNVAKAYGKDPDAWVLESLIANGFNPRKPNSDPSNPIDAMGAAILSSRPQQGVTTPKGTSPKRTSDAPIENKGPSTRGVDIPHFAEPEPLAPSLDQFIRNPAGNRAAAPVTTQRPITNINRGTEEIIGGSAVDIPAGVSPEEFMKRTRR